MNCFIQWGKRFLIFAFPLLNLYKDLYDFKNHLHALSYLILCDLIKVFQFSEFQFLFMFCKIVIIIITALTRHRCLWGCKEYNEFEGLQTVRLIQMCKTITHCYYCHSYSSQWNCKIESKRHYSKTNFMFIDILGKQNNKLFFFI